MKKQILIGLLSVILISIVVLAERLPINNGDTDVWGSILTNWSMREHTESGTHKNITVYGTGGVLMTANSTTVSIFGDLNVTGSINGANAVTGAGSSGNLTYWTGKSSIGNSSLYQSGSKLAIGTTNPQAIFYINDSDIGGTFKITNASGDNAFFVNSSGGRVDIGINAMSNITSDLGGAVTPVMGSTLYLSYQGTGSDAAYIDSAGAATASGLVLRRARGTLKNPIDVSNGDQIGYTDFRGYSGDRFWQQVSIAAYVDNTFTSGSPPPSRLAFFTNLANGSTERMRIDRNGYIYMNTQSQITGLTDSILTVKQNVNKGDYTAVIQGATNNTGNSYGLRIQAGTTSADIPFLVLSNSTSSTFFRINGNGYVGVGGNPTATFHVIDSTSIGAAVDISASGTAITNVAGLTLDNTQATTNNYAGILFGDNSASTNGASAIMGVQLTDRTNHYGDYAFATRGADGFLERMRIISTGKVGINTTAPAQTMTILGTLNVTAQPTRGSADLFVAPSGSVGISTVSPNDILEVVGSVRVSNSLNASSLNATNIFVNGGIVQRESNAFKIANGTALPFSAFTLQNVSNNTVAPFNASISLWNTTSTNIFLRENSYSVGLGTASPSEKLSIIGNINISGFGYFMSSIFVNGSVVQLQKDSFQLSNYSAEYSSTGFKIGNTTGLPFSNFQLANVSNDTLRISGNASISLWNTTSTNIFLRENSYSIGLGTVSPTEKLSVIGNVNVSGFGYFMNSIFVNGSVVQLQKDSFQISNYSGEYASTGFKIANGTALPFTNFLLANVSNDTLRISGNASIALWNVSGSNVFNRDFAAKIGINRTLPVATLDIGGNISVSAYNNSIGNLTMFQFNTTCGGFRWGTGGGLFLSCI